MVSGFKVIGLSVRTMNANGQSAKDMTMLWGRFFSENILHKIPNKNSDEILAIYTDYESDFTGDYTAIIGIAVSTLDDIPSGLIGREFKADNFQKFTAKGVMPQAVVDSWLDIWNGNAGLNRKYAYDFEVYGNISQNGENSEVDIYLSVL
jgi:predicted transcriptional regulator YdeE